MPQKEIYGNRDGERAYSAWHRTQSISRFIPANSALSLSMINIDHPVTLWSEYDKFGQTVALIESALDTGQVTKPSFVTKNLAARAGIPAYLVLIRLALNEYNPADPKWLDIKHFRVKKIYPDDNLEWQIFDPKRYAEFLLELRNKSQDNVIKTRDKQLYDLTNLVLQLMESNSQLMEMVHELDKKMSLRLFEKQIFNGKIKQESF